MTVHIVSLLVLLVMFLLASFSSVNLGVLALVAAFAVGAGLGGLDVDTVTAGFPGDLFVLLVGVTYLFGLAQDNGTLEWVVDRGIRLVGNRVAAVPWLMFALTAAVAAAGALSAAAVAVVAPIALRFAAQYRINPLLMGLMVAQGATAGAFSPLSPFGAITNGLLERNNLAGDSLGLFLNSLAFNVVAAVLVFCLLGGLHLLGDRAAPGAAAPDTGTPDTDMPGTDHPAAEPARGGTATAVRARPSTHQAMTLAGIAGLLAATIVLGLDVGFTALTIGLALTLLAPNRYGAVVKRVPWEPVLLVCGVLTYVGVLQEIGTVDFLGGTISASGSPLLAALAAAYVGAVISAFASTAGVLGASIPLAIPLLSEGALPVLGTVSAIGIASSVVDVSPLSTNGALLVANQRTESPKVFFRSLLLASVPVIALAPMLSWLVFVVL